MERPELHVVKSLIEELTGSAPEIVEGVKPPSGGLESWSYRLRSQGQHLYLKVNYAPNTTLGVQFNRRLRQAGIPTPEIVAWSPSALPTGLPCILRLCRRRPGELARAEDLPVR
ncbi:MAG TPA: hypothetical protein EYQ31_14885 [Candidatus Handelsmanbacteria bacterium]|nr:hypothetical protein [Candidatus Handelsmanbacteria bacterium]